MFIFIKLGLDLITQERGVLFILQKITMLTQVYQHRYVLGVVPLYIGMTSGLLTDI